MTVDFSEFLNPTDHPASYEKMNFDDGLTPGQVVVTAARTYGWDVKKATGSSGATITRTGDELVEFSTTFRLVRDEYLGIDELVEWGAFLPVIQKAIAGKVPIPLTVYHPMLAEIGVFQIVPKKIGALVLDGKGGATVQVDWIEYKPPAPKGGSVKKKDDPNADLKKQVEALTKEAAKP